MDETWTFYWEKDEKTMDYGDTSGDVVGID